MTLWSQPFWFPYYSFIIIFNNVETFSILPCPTCHKRRILNTFFPSKFRLRVGIIIHSKKVYLILIQIYYKSIVIYNICIEISLCLLCKWYILTRLGTTGHIQILPWFFWLFWYKFLHDLISLLSRYLKWWFLWWH